MKIERTGPLGLRLSISSKPAVDLDSGVRGVSRMSNAQVDAALKTIYAADRLFFPKLTPNHIEGIEVSPPGEHVERWILRREDGSRGNYLVVTSPGTGVHVVAESDYAIVQRSLNSAEIEWLRKTAVPAGNTP